MSIVNEFVHLNDVTKHRIEQQLIDTIKLSENKWIYDQNDPEYGIAKKRKEWFANFGDQCNPPLTGKQTTELWNKIVNKYNKTLTYHQLHGKDPRMSETLNKLSFLNNRKKKDINNKIIYVSNKDSVTCDDNDAVIYEYSLDDLDNSIIHNSTTNESTNENNALNSNKRTTNRILNKKKSIDNHQISSQQINHKRKLNEYSTMESKHDFNNKSRRSSIESNTCFDSNNLSKNSSIFGFQIQLGPLLENYVKITNNDLLALEQLKIKVTSLLVKETKDAQINSIHSTKHQNGHQDNSQSDQDDNVND